MRTTRIDLLGIVKVPLWVYAGYALWGTPLFWVLLVVVTYDWEFTIKWRGSSDGV